MASLAYSTLPEGLRAAATPLSSARWHALNIGLVKSGIVVILAKHSSARHDFLSCPPADLSMRNTQTCCLAFAQILA